jgi:elongation factor Ts
VTVGELVNQMISKLGENIAIRRFVRFKVGEGATSAEPPAAAAVPAS